MGEPGTAGNGRAALAMIKDDVKFYPHQIEGVRTLARRTSFLLADEMGGGKAQPMNALIATPNGWRPMGAMQPGDVICRPSGGTQTVSEIHPQGNQYVARVRFSDGTSTLCSWEHLWTVCQPGDEWVTMTTAELARGELSTEEGPRWETPLLRPIEGTSGFFDHIGPDPFTTGFIAAGGLSFEAQASHPARVRVAAGRYEAAKMLRIPNVQLTYRHETTGSEPRGMKAYLEPVAGHPEALREYLAKLHDVGITRHTGKRMIHPDILFDYEGNRWRFLMGMMAAALVVEPAGQHRVGLKFHPNTSSDFLSSVVKLINLLGGVAIADNPSGRATFWWPTPIQLWNGVTLSTPRPVRSIVSIAPAGRTECQCITVDDPEGLYVTHSGIVTHNSLQALAVTALDYELGNREKVAIVCPATLKDNWAAEIAQHTNFKTLVLNGTKPKREKMLEAFRSDPETHIVILNYEQVDAHLDGINAAQLSTVIFDEAHYLKTPKSKRTKACFKIAARRSFLLTGSPMLNQPQELWGILHRINPQEFPSYWKFTQRFCTFGGFQGKAVTGVKNELELLEILDRYMLRRLKSEMIQLPAKNFIPVKVNLSALQRKLYEEAETELRLMIPDEPEPMELENAMVKILRLKQITGTPFTLGFDDDSAKLDTAMQLAAQLIMYGEKIVVFTQFRGVLEAMETRLIKAGIPVWTLSGDTPGPKRIPMVHEWRDSPRPGVMLSMLQVGGVGVDFTAASNMIFLDKLYVPAMNDQAVDRCHRLSMDKTKEVNIYELTAVGTVEDRVEKILARKRKMTDKIIDNTAFRKLVVAALHEDE